MRNFRLIRGLVSLGAIPVILSTSGKLVAQSTQPKSTAELQPRDSNMCVEKKGFWWGERNEFALGREIFSPRWVMQVESEIVCRANRKYRTLRLDVAMKDEAKGVVTISVYRDGNQVNALSISGGKKTPMFFDITGAKFFSIATTCDGGECDRVYVSRAQLDLAAQNPGARNK